MHIHEMTAEECRTVLKHTDFGRLACVRGQQPYIVPVYVSYDGEHLYGVTTPGRKVEWLRANPLVCVEFDEWTDQTKWLSVVLFGRYEELIDTAENHRERAHALEVLEKRTMWWEPACVPTERHAQRPPVFYRIHIGELTGRRAMPDVFDSVGGRPDR